MKQFNTLILFFKNFDKKKIYLFFFQIFISLLSIVVGKIIAIYVEPSVFGEFSLIFSAIAFVISLFIRPVINTFNFYLQKDEIINVINNFFNWSFVFFVILLILSSFAYFTKILDLKLILIIFSFLVFDMFYSYKLNFYNITDDNQTHLNLAFIFKISHILFLFFFLYILNYSSVNILIFCLAIANFFPIIYSFFKNNIWKKLLLYKSNQLLYNFKEVTVNIFHYAYPIILLSMFTWLVQYVDRWMINYFMLPSNVGYYTANSGLGSKFMIMLAAPFLMFLKSIVFSNVKNKVSFNSTISSSYRYFGIYFAFSLFVLFFLAYFHEYIGLIFLSNKYEDGFIIIVTSAISLFFLGATQIFEISFYAYNKTSYILYGYILASILNIIGNYILIPIYGILGAGIALIFSSFVQLIFSNLLFKGLKKIQL